MLSRELNERIVRVGAGTPMGAVLRAYWLPALLSDEIQCDGAPLRVRLLGEDLVAFRDSSGQVGLIQSHCPHRGASLFFGRNEGAGLRCVYHGWKFDAHGTCLEMPNEPPNSAFQARVQAAAYPTSERNGVVWAYLGPRSEIPELPDLEWNLVPAAQRYVTKRVQQCNWVQAVEGGIDPSHSGFLHAALHVDPSALRPRDRYRLDKRPRFALLETAYGLRIGARRPADAQRVYWSVTHFMMPFYNVFNTSGGEPEPSVGGFAWVPMDDTTTLAWCFTWNPRRQLRDDEQGDHPRVRTGVHLTPSARLPTTSAPGGAWRPVANRSNDYLLDRDLQRTRRFFGVPGISPQDAAVQESMGPIADRTDEHLGSSDSALIQVRRLWLNAVDERARGGIPLGIASPHGYRVRATEFVIDAEEDWTSAAADWVTGRPEARSPLLT
ncbi:MAG: Rieske 2Fe-2S domain-containing protein [Chloroflexi bacterium]|nr:Rieske 2Fe-2S domain-containing protein [Chloroflexota bacterium]